MAAQPLKILVGIVTYNKHGPFIKELLASLRNQTVLQTVLADILVVDNSESKLYSKELQQHGIEVLYDAPGEKNRIQRIVSGRELLRKECLKRGYSHLWFVDSDTIPPKDALEKLLAAEKQIISGVVLSRMNINGRFGVFPALYAKTEKKGSARLMSVEEVKGKGVIEIDISGFACCLIKKEVLENVPLRYYGQSQSGEDVAFHVDAHKQGFKSFAALSVKCKHLGDNEVLEIKN